MGVVSGVAYAHVVSSVGIPQCSSFLIFLIVSLYINRLVLLVLRALLGALLGRALLARRVVRAVGCFFPFLLFVFFMLFMSFSYYFPTVVAKHLLLAHRFSVRAGVDRVRRRKQRLRSHASQPRVVLMLPDLLLQSKQAGRSHVRGRRCHRATHLYGVNERHRWCFFVGPKG